MIDRDTFRYGFYAAVAALILALTAIFGKFETLTVAGGELSLSYVLLVAIFVGVGYLTSSKTSERGIVPAAVNGAVGSLIVGAALVLLILLEANIDLTFIFPDLKTDPIGPVLTFNQGVALGCILLFAAAALGGIVGGLLHSIPSQIRRVVLVSLGMTVVVGLLEDQISNVMTLPDALAIALVFGISYGVAARIPSGNLPVRLGIGVGIGLVAGLILGLIANSGGLDVGGMLRGAGTMPRILGASPGNAVVPLLVVFGIVGTLGAVMTSAASSIHNGAKYLVSFLLLLGVLNWQGTMTYLAAAITFILVVAMLWLVPSSIQQS